MLTTSNVITKLKPYKFILFNVFGLVLVISVFFIVFNAVDNKHIELDRISLNKDIIIIQQQLAKLSQRLKIRDINVDLQSKKFILLTNLYSNLLVTAINHGTRGYLYAVSGGVRPMLLMLKRLKSQNTLEYSLQKISIEDKKAAAQILIYGISELNIK